MIEKLKFELEQDRIETKNLSGSICSEKLKYDETKPHILSFSGGQTSGFMLWNQIQRYGIVEFNKRFKVIFENTGKEHDETLNFVHNVETGWSVPIIWLEYTRVPARDINPDWVPAGVARSNLIKKQDGNESAHWFKVVSFDSAKRRDDPNTPFDELLRWANVLPNVRTRSCSVQLKVRTRDRYLRFNGIEHFNAYIGIRKDEDHRKLEILANIDRYEMPQFPLCDDGTTKCDVDSFWDKHDFKLNIPNHMGNCDLCFLKAKRKLVLAAKMDNKAAEWWRLWEEKFASKTYGDGAFFNKSRSYASIIEEAKMPELFDEIDEDVACSCAIGGYRNKNNEEE